MDHCAKCYYTGVMIVLMRSFLLFPWKYKIMRVSSRVSVRAKLHYIAVFYIELDFLLPRRTQCKYCAAHKSKTNYQNGLVGLFTLR